MQTLTTNQIVVFNLASAKNVKYHVQYVLFYNLLAV